MLIIFSTNSEKIMEHLIFCIFKCDCFLILSIKYIKYKIYLMIRNFLEYLLFNPIISLLIEIKILKNSVKIFRLVVK